MSEEKPDRGYVNVYELKDGGRKMEIVFKTKDTPEENAQHYEREAQKIKKQENQG